MKLHQRQPRTEELSENLKSPKLLLLFSFIGSVAFSGMVFGVQNAEAVEVFKRRGPAQARPEAAPINEALAKEEAGKVDEALKILTRVIEKESVAEKRALARFAKAVALDRNGRIAEADVEYTSAIADGLRVADYAYFYRGVLRKKQGLIKEAKADLEKVVESRAPGDTIVDARMMLAEMELGEKQWKNALKNLTPIRKRTRSHPRYPEVLYGLFIAEKKSGVRGGGCKWARELYSKFPTHTLIKNWGPVLGQNSIGEEKTGCQSTTADLKSRVRRLQLGGEAQRASQELQLLKGDKEEGGQYGVDAMLANHLVSEGHVEDAMKLLLKHYETQKNRPPYLTLLGKAASRAGEYQSAIGAYQRAYDLAPKSKDAASALFQAGFTGYQIQDYDGATRRFEKLTKAFPGSAYTRDAKWYMSWIRYLRGDYEGALESFKTLSKAPKMRRGRRAKPSDALSQDRLKYWSAMSLVKLGRNQEAIPLLQTLVRDPAIGYYSVLSFYRLLSIPGAKLPTGIETRLGLKKSESGPLAAPTEEEIKAAAEAVETAAADAEAESDEEAQTGSTEADAVVANENEEAGASETDSEADGSFKNASFAQRFDRARDLSLVGLLSDARRELGEIERTARRTEDRKLLMIEYAAVEQYNRSSTIGDLGFSQQRLRSGLRGDGKSLWEYAYPRAWDPTVREMSKTTGVPEELIWGIMRAESQYRSEVQSPVGAMGLMQIMPFTGRQLANLVSMGSFETRSLLEPSVNIKLGSRYLQRLLEKFSGSVPLVAAGYNAGPHRVHAWVRGFGSLEMDEFIEHVPYLETRNYVKKVVRNFQIYSLLYSGGTHSLRWLVQPVGVELDERIPTKEVW